MGQGVPRRGKPHCEAFPRIDILRAEKGMRMGHPFCEWSNEDGQVIGWARILALDAQSASFKFVLFGSLNVERADGKISLDVVGSRRNPHVVRKAFLCPQCRRKMESVFWVSGEWACRICHGLVYLKQRLGFVNKRLCNRDEMIAELLHVPPEQQRTRWFHNRRRHIERINRNLVSEGFEALPRELLFRTSERWLADDHDVQSYKDDEHPASMFRDVGKGLSFFQPSAPIGQSSVPCEAVGSIILDRPLERYLAEHIEEQADQLRLERIASGTAALMNTDQDPAAPLARRLGVEPLVLSDWSGMIESVDDDGRARFSITAGYIGSPALWKFGPAPRSSDPLLRAILTEKTVTLQVRVPRGKISDPEAALRATRDALASKLEGARTLIERFRAERRARAEAYVRDL